MKDNGIKIIGNRILLEGFSGFKSGDFNSTELCTVNGVESIALMQDDNGYVSRGEYITEIIDTPPFKSMVASWNTETPPETYVEVRGRALVNYIDNQGEVCQRWSQWFSWGKWSPFINRASESFKGILARIGTDEFAINGDENNFGSKVQLKIILYSKDKNSTPSLRLLHGTLKNNHQPINKVFEDDLDVSNLDKIIETPAYAQGIRDPRTSFSICSPTTITMIMNGKGESLLPDEVAQSTNDTAYGFGNWAFCTAAVGSYGYRSYVDFTNIEGLKRQIAKGYPVGVSVRYTNNPENDKLPFIENSPGDTPGHIMVVKGFTKIDGIEYVAVNDSYGKDDSKVSRLYKLDQFEKAWANRVAYIIEDKVEGAGNHHIMRLSCDIKPTEVPGEYAVYYGEDRINLVSFSGVITYTTDGDQTYKYLPPEHKNTLSLIAEDYNNPKLKLYVITNLGLVYIYEK